MFDEEDSRKIEGLLAYCELDSVGELLKMAMDTMYDVIEAEKENERA